MASDIQSPCDYGYGVNVSSTGGKDPNQVGPGSLSSGGPIDTPTEDKGMSTDSLFSTQTIPQGGDIDSPVDMA